MYQRSHVLLTFLFIQLIVIFMADTVQALDPNLTYYLYEEGTTPSGNCLGHDPLERQSIPLILSSVVKGCRVFQMGADGTIKATTSTTSPKPTEWCIDAGSGPGNDGDLIQLLGCHGTPNQVWHETENGKLRGMNGKCIVRGPGPQVVLGPCLRGIKWRLKVWTPD
jgi:hypothetical protein